MRRSHLEARARRRSPWARRRTAARRRLRAIGRRLDARLGQTRHRRRRILGNADHPQTRLWSQARLRRRRRCDLETHAGRGETHAGPSDLEARRGSRELLVQPIARLDAGGDPSHGRRHEQSTAREDDGAILLFAILFRRVFVSLRILVNQRDLPLCRATVPHCRERAGEVVRGRSSITQLFAAKPVRGQGGSGTVLNNSTIRCE